MRVLVTGAAGYLGRALVPALLTDPRVEQVLTTDRLPLDRAAAPSRHTVLDLATASDGEVLALLAGADTVIHLAFQMAPRPGEDARPTNIGAQERFLALACRGARRIVVMSAAAAYGFAPGRDPLMSKLAEDAPLTTGTRVAYADDKQALERLLDRLSAEHPAVTVIRARPSNVAGPHLPVARAPQLAGQLMLAPATPHPLRQQLLHEHDFTSACLHLLEAPAGAYNMAPDDWLTMQEAARRLGQRYVAMPSWALRPLVDWAWRAGSSLFDASWLAFLEHPPVILDNAKLRALGWRPLHTTAETLDATIAGWRAKPPPG